MRKTVLSLALFALFSCSMHDGVGDPGATYVAFYCAECCDSLYREIPHYELDEFACMRNGELRVNDHAWAWKAGERKGCGDLPCPPEDY